VLRNRSDPDLFCSDLDPYPDIWDRTLVRILALINDPFLVCVKTVFKSQIRIRSQIVRFRYTACQIKKRDNVLYSTLVIIAFQQRHEILPFFNLDQLDKNSKRLKSHCIGLTLKKENSKRESVVDYVSAVIEIFRRTGSDPVQIRIRYLIWVLTKEKK
jgi:hypothetical protein